MIANIELMQMRQTNAIFNHLCFMICYLHPAAK